MNKYKLGKKESNGLCRIIALLDFGGIKKGDIGGYVNSKDNLSQEGLCWVYGDAWVSGTAQVSGTARVYGDAQVSGDAWVYGDAQVYGTAQVQFGQLDFDIKQNTTQYIACSLNVYPIDGYYYLYKRVNKIKTGEYVSCYDSQFVYKDRQESIATDVDESWDVSCGSGLHVSTPFYWSEGDTLIAVKVHKDDVITCQEGKIRCRKLTVIGEVKHE